MSKRVAIVGAGILGAAIAYRLSKHGADVRVLEAGEPGQQATRASFAWINARNKNPREYHALNRQSMDRWAEFTDELGDVGWIHGGELRWATSGAGAEDIESRVALLRDWGYPIQLLDETEAHALEPDLPFRDFRVASYSEADTHVNAPLVTRRCLELAVEHGACLNANCEVTGIVTQGALVTGLETSLGPVDCDVALLAAGAATPKLASASGARSPGYDTFGATVVTTPVDPIFQTVCVIHAPREDEIPINVRQMGDGRVVIHGGRHGHTRDASHGTTDREAQELLHCACRYFPGLDATTVDEVRRARRPIPEDGQSIVGFSREIPNLYIVTTHSGVTLAPLLSEIATTEVLDGAQDPALAPFRPSRFT